MVGLQNTFMSQQQQKTQEILANWSRDKPHYEKVRAVMSDLLQPNETTGRSVIPLKDGAVDLDSAYLAAVKLVPEVWEAEQASAKAAEEAKVKAAAEAKKKADAEAAEKAKRASASLTPGAPGTGSSAGGAKPKKGKSVKESLMDSIEELRAS